MNKLNHIIVVLILFTLLARVAWANNTVAFPTGNASWTVSVDSYGTSKGLPQTYIQDAEITQINDVKRIVLNWSDGKTTEKWSVPKLPVEFEQDPRDGRVNTFQNGSLHINIERFYATYDSFAFDWVTPAALQEKTPISYQGQQCYHFVSSATAPDSGLTFKREAWINATTSLPVAYDNGVSISTYKFSSKTPEGPLDFPPAFKTAVHYYKITMGYQ